MSTGIERFSSTYSMVGGVNAPKKLTCTGTDGKVRLQLVKGKDDLRQDAVMEQVFGLMNNLLDQNEETRKRKLKILITQHMLHKTRPSTIKGKFPGTIDFCF